MQCSAPKVRNSNQLLYGFSLAANGLPFSFGEHMYKCRILNPLTDDVIDEFEVDYLYEARLRFADWYSDNYLCVVWDEYGDLVDVTSDIDRSEYEPSEYDEWMSYDPDC